MQLLNNSILLASRVGINETAVVCKTGRRPCCKTGPAKYGEWYYNNSMVPRMSVGWLFYRDRTDNGTINLNRVNESNEVTGKFCCQAPDKYCDGLNHILCVELGKINANNN
jgi:hypothetical protein